MEQKAIKIIFGVAVLVLAVASTWSLSSSPATWFDEGINLGIVKSLITKSVYSLEIAPDSFINERPFLITTNYPVLFPVALSLKIFGINLMAARLPMVLFLWGFALVSYLLVKKMYSAKAATLTVALLVSFVPFYGNGKAVLGEIPGLLYLLIGLLLISNASLPKLFAAGIFFGLSAATKPFFLIIIPALLVGEIYAHRSSAKELTRRLPPLLAGAAAPLILWLYLTLQTPIFASFKTAIAYYSNSYASSGFLGIIGNNILRFFTETTPIHFALLLIVAITAVAIKIKRENIKLKEVEIILFSFIILNLAWYLKTPGWYRYFFTAHILLFLFFPNSLERILNKKMAVAIVLALFLIQTSMLYTKRLEPLYYSRAAANIATTLNGAQNENKNILIFNSPSISFLLNRAPSQYLQINPVLAFGEPSLASANGKLYDIIVGRSLDGLKIEDLRETLDKNYTSTNQDGYIVYQRR